ncbi:MAG: exodeoxyribonuclease V subunit alpha [Thermodesulfobacteriota bacterium]|nr:exodeoxyribonuclease V subunit alpha [Thermodesulfobacteriota bacterium]
MNRKYIQCLLDNGVFSEIDVHFAGLMARLSGKDVPELFLAAALASRAASEGHVCLDLSSVEERILLSDEPGLGNFFCPDLLEWRKVLCSSRVIGRPGDYCPLILDDRSRLYLYRYWQYEKTLADDIRARVAREITEIDLPRLQEGLSRLFPQTLNGEPDRQKEAAFVSVMRRFCVISGGPGTGKSTVIAKIVALLLGQTNANQQRIALAAPTGKAAVRLEEAISNNRHLLPVTDSIREAIATKASTIHRLLETSPGSPYFRHNAVNQLPVDTVIIDEASMVDLALMSKLVQAVPPEARLILLGDKDQLASVEAGAVLGDICDTRRNYESRQTFSSNKKSQEGMVNPYSIQDCVVQLNKSYRFGTDSGIGALSRAVNEGDGRQALSLLKGREYRDIAWMTLPLPLPARGSARSLDGGTNTLVWALRKMIVQGYRPYLEARDPMEVFHLFERFRILCAIRKGPHGVSALNLLAEQILKEEKLINPENLWYPGRPVMVTRNEYNLGLFNGDIGIILPDPAVDHDLRVFFVLPNGTLRKVMPTRLPEHETVYAMTVHKSQGSEFDKALLLLPDRHTPVLTRELIYTGITRARQNIEVWGLDRLFLEGVSRRTARASGLRDALWGL